MDTLEKLCTEIREELAIGVTQPVTEFAVDRAVESGLDGDSIDIVWSKEKPSVLATVVEKTTLKQPIGIWVNPWGRMPTKEERAALKEAIGKYNSLTTQTSRAWIVARLRSFEGLRAWSLPVAGVDGEIADKVVAEKDDLKLVALETVGHLVLEGRQCQNCIGQRQMSYRERLKDKHYTYVSVRSTKNFEKALVTAEIHKGKVLQAQGRCGSVPSPEALALVSHYAASQRG